MAHKVPLVLKAPKGRKVSLAHKVPLALKAPKGRKVPLVRALERSQQRQSKPHWVALRSCSQCFKHSKGM